MLKLARTAQDAALTTPGRAYSDEVERSLALPLADQIAFHERALVALRAQQRAELLVTIATVVGTVPFTAAELFAHGRVSPELAAGFAAAGIQNPRQLGKRLRDIPHGLERIGVEHGRALWVVVTN